MAVLHFKGLPNLILCKNYALTLNKECKNALPCSVHTVSIDVL